MFILGTVQFGLKYGINNLLGKIDPDEVFRILDYAVKSGVEYLDTAPVYGNAEKLIGEYLKEYKNSSFKINTKFDLKNNRSLSESIEKSLLNLGVPAIDSILFHSYGDYCKRKVEIEDFEKKYSSKYRKIGVSVYTNEELQEVISCQFIQIIQLPFNLFDNEFHRGELLKIAKDKGKEIHVRSVFLQGLFFTNRLNIPPQLAVFKSKLEYLDLICKRFSTDISSLAVQYVKSKSYIDGIIFGVDTLDQLKSNISSFTRNVTAEALDLVDKIEINDSNLLNPSRWNLK